MKHTKKWTLIYATGWLVIGIGLIAVSGYQWIALGQAIVSVGYAIGGGCCIVPAIIMFLKWHREEEIDLNAEKEELKKQLALTEKACQNKEVKELKEKQKKIADLEAKLEESEESEERLKAIDNWKENYGYTNYEDIYMLEDLQSRAFQSEDDTTVVNEILDYLNISDENEILPTIKQQLAEKDEQIKMLQEHKEMADNTIEMYATKCKDSGQDKISFAVDKLTEVKEFFLEEHRDEEMDTDYLITKDACQIAEYLLDQIKQLKEGK